MDNVFLKYFLLTAQCTTPPPPKKREKKDTKEDYLTKNIFFTVW